MSRRRAVRVYTFLAAILLMISAALVIMERTLAPSLEAVIKHTIRIRAIEAINRAVLDRVVGVEYSDLYLIRENREGLVSFLQPNTSEINRIASQVTLTVQQELKKMEDQYFGIYLSQILGSKLWATRGPAIWVGMESIGSVQVNVDSRFEQAGLNQTRHSVYMKIRAEVQAVTPTYRMTFPIEETIPLAEGIIVGPVPSGMIFGLDRLQR